MDKELWDNHIACGHVNCPEKEQNCNECVYNYASYIKACEEENAELKARLEGLPSKGEIGQILCEACGRGCIRFCDDFIHQRKAIHDRIHKENKCQ